jgi:hypothetical protein
MDLTSVLAFLYRRSSFKPLLPKGLISLESFRDMLKVMTLFKGTRGIKQMRSLVQKLGVEYTQLRVENQLLSIQNQLLERELSCKRKNTI